MFIKKCLIDEIKHLVNDYSKTLSSPIDSFLEQHILSSDFYVILDGSEEVGYYAIHQNELLTQFYIKPSYLKVAQELFSKVIEDHTVKSLFVPTSDELFVSLALDKDFQITKQAYFFQDSHIDLLEKESLHSDVFVPATLDDLIPMQQMCGDFLDQYEYRITNGELFTYYRDSVLLGVGVVEKNRILDGLASIGMFTNENYRNQGIGKNIILKLKKWCYSHQLEPICGCWYYNEASKRTLESAGMITKTRLLNIKVNPSE
ncbi:GNAT family N-acetyltransferase [Paenibacillus donghaensis]|uniref:GNAT family N-acetyltransferase n=1 Tax=Paenibacillus donghaensis TaxID=414771 RepID=UPI00188410C2|nr:GNAT family N-acetyltransferase [Paenibacillus donghaensis]MBE9914799.1 GNAT family N-acetyltransferase [Paenibacillus donghaensis]